jgi:hypothetical protein
VSGKFNPSPLSLTPTCRIDIRQRVRHLSRDPRGDERQKIEKLRTSLAPLLVELTRLQVNAGVFQCATTLPLDPTTPLGEQPLADALEALEAQTYPDIEDPLAHWDAVVQDLDEPPVPIAPQRPPRRASSRRTRSAGPLVEDQILYVPSNQNVTPRDDAIELGLRKQQAKAQLHQLRELISHKSFLYSDVIRKAPRKGVRTRTRGTIKGINTQISLHCQVYSHCRSRLIALGADDETISQFRELRKEDINASTAILTPNTPGSTSLKLSWIWHDVSRHILPAVDAELPATDAATILECMPS